MPELNYQVLLLTDCWCRALMYTGKNGEQALNKMILKVRYLLHWL